MEHFNFSKEINSYLNLLSNGLLKLNRDEVNNFINLLIKARDDNKQIFIMGNGGSAATASHFCCDFNKGCSFDGANRFKFICLNDNIPTIMAYANDIDYDSVFVEQLKNFFNEGDYLIGISGSGNSKNVLKAVEYANSHKGITIGLTGYDGGQLKQLCHFSVNININDMQISEDIHMIMDHLTMKIISSLHKNN